MDDAANAAYDGDPDRALPAHFAEACGKAVDYRRQEIATDLSRVWPPDDTRPDNIRREVVKRLVEEVRVHPVSALQYRFLRIKDPARRSFLETPEQSGIPSLQESLQEAVQDRRRSRANRLREARGVFCSQVVSGLRILQTHWQGEEESVRQAERLRGQLEPFIKPLSDEFKLRQREFRTFLRQTLPVQIDKVIAEAHVKARQELNLYLKRLKKTHPNTLKAAILRAAEGKSFKGTNSDRIDLPHEFTLRFEEPVAEAWGKHILTEVRKQTRDYASDCVALVDKVVEWAHAQRGTVPTDQVENQRESLRASARKLELVGREVADQLRLLVRQQLLDALRGPVQAGCKQFVADGFNRGTGVRDRILDFLDELADQVTNAGRHRRGYGPQIVLWAGGERDKGHSRR